MHRWSVFSFQPDKKILIMQVICSNVPLVWKHQSSLKAVQRDAARFYFCVEGTKQSPHSWSLLLTLFMGPGASKRPLPIHSITSWLQTKWPLINVTRPQHNTPAVCKQHNSRPQSRGNVEILSGRGRFARCASVNRQTYTERTPKEWKDYHYLVMERVHDLRD